MVPSRSMTAATHAERATELITRFETRFNTREFDAIMADMTEDCVFEHVAPAAVSFGRHEGQAAVRGVWVSLAEHFPRYHFDIEDVFWSHRGEFCTFDVMVGLNGPTITCVPLAEVVAPCPDIPGLDVVPGMLERARGKAGGLPVRWIEGDARTFDLDEWSTVPDPATSERILASHAALFGGFRCGSEAIEQVGLCSRGCVK